MPDKKPRRGRKPKRAKHQRQVPAAAQTTGRPEKTPRVEADVDVYSLKPTWSFAYLDIWWGTSSAGGCGWIHLAPVDHQELLDRFQVWERMTWREILLAPGSPNHAIPVAKLFAPARARLQALKLEDIDEVVSLRVNSKARVFGVLSGGTFKIMWWDQHHQICPSKMKGT